MPRRQVETSYTVGDRTVTIVAMDAVGPEDVYSNAIQAVLHRYKTGEDLLMPAAREVKDFVLKTNLAI
jgi:hypothetical protein